jgi:Fic family protein
LRDSLFIAMSNHYYENKAAYLQALNDTRAAGHDLTPFLQFARKGIESQCRRLLAEIRLQLQKALYRNTVADLFGRLKSPRKPVMSARHVQILTLLLDEEALTLPDLARRTAHIYTVKNPMKALLRDLNYLLSLQAMSAQKRDDPPGHLLAVNLDWPTQITETEFFRRVREMPKGKVYA